MSDSLEWQQTIFRLLLDDLTRPSTLAATKITIPSLFNLCGQVMASVLRHRGVEVLVAWDLPEHERFE